MNAEECTIKSKMDEKYEIGHLNLKRILENSAH
jgi:hypothetical protein